MRRVSRKPISVRNVATPDIGRPSTVISRTRPSESSRMRSAPPTGRPPIRPSQKNACVSRPSNGVAVTAEWRTTSGASVSISASTSRAAIAAGNACVMDGASPVRRDPDRSVTDLTDYGQPVPPDLAAQTSSALVDTWQALMDVHPEAWIDTTGGVTACATGIPTPALNGVFVSTLDPDPADIRRYLAEMRRRGLPHMLQL